MQNSTNSFTNPNSTGNDTQKPSLLAAALAYNKKDKQPPKPKSSGSGGGSVNDDWQNVSFFFHFFNFFLRCSCEASNFG